MSKTQGRETVSAVLVLGSSPGFSKQVAPRLTALTYAPDSHVNGWQNAYLTPSLGHSPKQLVSGPVDIKY